MKEGIYLRIATLVLACCAVDSLSAQNPTSTGLTLRQWTIEDGLPQSTVRSMIRTRDGFLWVATWRGFARFDGVQFHSYSARNVPAFTSDQVRCLFQDRSGTLWIGTTGGGLLRFNQGSFERYGDEAGLTSANISDIVETVDGTLYFGTTKGLFRFNENGFVQDSITPTLAHPEIRQVQQDTLGRIWLRTPLGSLRFSPTDPQSRLWLREIRYTSFLEPGGTIWFEHRPFGLASYNDSTGITNHPGFSHKELSAISVQNNGTIWVGTVDGVSRIHNNSSEHYSRVGRISLSGLNWIRDDDEGNIWTSGSGRGLIRLREKLVRTFDKDDGLSGNLVTCMLERRDGSMVVGTEGTGLNTGTMQKFRRTMTRMKADFANIYALLEDSRNSLWVGTWGAGLFRIEDDSVTRFKNLGAFPQSAITALAEDTDGIIWIGTPSNGLFTFRDGAFRAYPVEGFHERLHVDCLLASSGGGVWMGTRGNGLYRIKDGSIRRFNRHSALGSDFVQTLHEDERGILWIGTAAGLSRLKGEQAFIYSASNGITDGVVMQLLQDDRGFLWYGGMRGIYRIPRSDLDEVAAGNRKRMRVETFGKQDGMPITEVNGGGEPRAWKGADGRLWFTTGAGVVEVDPSRVERSIPPPKAVVEKIRVDGHSQDLHREVVIQPGNARMEVTYTGLGFAAPEAIIFRYRLDGFDRTWTEAGHRREAVYTNLPYGTYSFRLAASNGDEVWTEQQSGIRIVALAPFWRTPWFLSLLGLVLVVGGPAVFFYRTRQLQRRHRAQAEVTERILAREEEARKKIAGELHDNVAQKLVLLANRARRTFKHGGSAPFAADLQAIEELARSSLDDVKATSKELRPLHLEEIGLARSLLSLARTVREASGIEIQTDIDTSLALTNRDHEINVYRIAQEGFNNILKHSGSSSAVISWRAAAGTAVFHLKDRGTGFPTSGRESGLGLRSMKERARIIGGRIEIRQADEGGTILELRIPHENGS